MDNPKCPYCGGEKEWHKFDKDDLHSFPQCGKSIMLFHRDGYVAEGEYIGNGWRQYRWSAILKEDEVTHWSELPCPPMENMINTIAVKLL